MGYEIHTDELQSAIDGLKGIGTIPNESNGRSTGGDWIPDLIDTLGNVVTVMAEADPQIYSNDQRINAIIEAITKLADGIGASFNAIEDVADGVTALGEGMNGLSDGLTALGESQQSLGNAVSSGFDNVATALNQIIDALS